MTCFYHCDDEMFIEEQGNAKIGTIAIIDIVEYSHFNGLSKSRITSESSEEGGPQPVRENVTHVTSKILSADNSYVDLVHLTLTLTPNPT